MGETTSSRELLKKLASHIENEVVQLSDTKRGVQGIHLINEAKKFLEQVPENNFHFAYLIQAYSDVKESWETVGVYSLKVDSDALMDQLKVEGRLGVMSKLLPFEEIIEAMLKDRLGRLSDSLMSLEAFYNRTIR